MDVKYIGLRASIRKALGSCMVSFSQPNRAKSFQEPDFTAGIVTELPALLNSKGGKWGLKFEGGFIHQSPQISYRDDNGVSSRCELGDLLVVVRDCKEDRYNAALFQLKMEDPSGASTITPDPKQLYIYTKWPEFYWRKIGISYCIVPKTISQGALYGVVHPCKSNGNIVGARVNVATAAQSIPVNGQSFEDYLYDLIDFRAGRTFVYNPKTRICDGWSTLLTDLCSYIQVSFYNRKNINKFNVPRASGNLFSLMGKQNDVEHQIPKVNLDNDNYEFEGSEGGLGFLYIERIGSGQQME